MFAFSKLNKNIKCVTFLPNSYPKMGSQIAGDINEFNLLQIYLWVYNVHFQLD